MKKYITYTLINLITITWLFADYDVHTDELSGDYSNESHVDSVWDNAWVKSDTTVIFSKNGTNYTRASFKYTNLTNASFYKANLTDANFDATILDNVDFTDAIIKGAKFLNVVTQYYRSGQITSEQLYSTASYKNKDLRGVGFLYYDLTGYDFSGQDLTGANFMSAILSNVNFSNAKIDGAYFSQPTSFGGLAKEQLYSTISYKNKNLSGIVFSYTDMCGWDLSGQNLTGATFMFVDMNDIDLTNSIINNVKFVAETSRGFTKEKLYSTASYKNKDLTGIDFSGASGYDYNSLWNCDFSSQNLSNTNFSGVPLNGSSLTNSNLRGANLEYADLTSVDLRGAILDSPIDTPFYKNTIMTDGEIKNFSMSSAEDNFSIRKYEPVTAGGAIINAKIVEDAKIISGGAVLTLEEGAVLEISAGKTLTVSDNGEIVFDVDAAADDTNIILNSGSKLVFGDNSKLTINLTGEVSETDPLHFTVIKAAEDSYVLGLDFLPKDNIILNVNGTEYDSSKWGINFDPTTGTLDISVNIPEPATYATIFTVLALGFVAYRRRK